MPRGPRCVPQETLPCGPHLFPLRPRRGPRGRGAGPAAPSALPSRPPTAPSLAGVGGERRFCAVSRSDLAPGLPGLLYPTLPERQRSDPNGPRPRVGTPRGRLPLRAARLLPHQPRGPRRRAAGASRAASPPPRSTGAELVALGTRIKMQICIPVLSLPSSFSVISPGTPHSPAAPKCPCSWGPMAQGLRNKGRGLHVPPGKHWLSCWPAARADLTSALPLASGSHRPPKDCGGPRFQGRTARNLNPRSRQNARVGPSAGTRQSHRV